MRLMSEFLIPLAILLSMAISATSQDGDEFSYKEGTERGPERWGLLKPDWAACGNGRMQSPLDVTDDRVKVSTDLTPLSSSYRPANAAVKNRGHDVMVRWDGDAGGIEISGTSYSLKQLHWHWPSEHTINGRRLSLEMHMVHESADKKIAVVGILYEIGSPDSFLSKMEGFIRSVRDIDEAEVQAGTVNPGENLNGITEYYRYMGSLTTPPCTEGVVWTIVKRLGTVSNDQVRLLREAFDDETEKNARPIQQINDRTINLYKPINRKLKE